LNVKLENIFVKNMIQIYAQKLNNQYNGE